MSRLALAGMILFGGLAVMPAHVGATPETRPGAQFVRFVPLGDRVELALGLPLRNQMALSAVLEHEANGARPISQRLFDARFGATRAQISRVLTWAHGAGLRTGYVSADGLVIELDGSAGAVEDALDTHIAVYRRHGARLEDLTGPVNIPSRLGIQSVIGLDSAEHGYIAGSVRTEVREPYGYYPRDFRRAYDVGGAGVGGLGQRIGIILWGVPVPQYDFADFAKVTGVPSLVTCNSQPSCSKPSTIRWVDVDGVSSDGTAVGEAAMDSEYLHAMAPRAKITFFLAKSYSEPDLLAAIGRAANDPNIHLVSDSWGSTNPPGGDGFEQAATNEFEHAAAVGTTFLFASGDSGFVSSTRRPVFPTASPFVASVGGTTLQMNATFTKRTAETVWNSVGTVIGPATNGGGSGCAIGPLFRRQSWERGWTGATCSGRAYPDFSADADSENSPGDFIIDGSEANAGGTSLASPLWTGLLADGDRFLQLHHQPRAGFIPMAISRILWDRKTNSVEPPSGAVFYDIRCGYNGVPAAPGWDEATGWGSPNWRPMVEALAGMRVRSKTSDTDCVDAHSWPQLWLPFRQWYRGTVIRSGWGHPVTLKWEHSDDNVSLRVIRPTPRLTGFKGGVIQWARLRGSQGGPNAVEIRLATRFTGPRAAARFAHSVSAELARKPGSEVSNCSSLTPICHQYDLRLGPNRVADYTISSVTNIVDESMVLAPTPDYIVGNWLAVKGIDHDLEVTRDSLTQPPTQID